LKQRFGVNAELIEGSNGVFEVTVDGSLVFSKRQLGRFPETGEIVEVIARRS
jgi:selT/selW/selH-like putative selenoprotein